MLFHARTCGPEAYILTGRRNYILQLPWDVIMCPCPWYPLRTEKSLYSKLQNNGKTKIPENCDLNFSMTSAAMLLVITDVTAIYHNDADTDHVLVQGHYSDVIMSAMASQITGVSIVCSTVGSRVDQRKHRTSRHWPLCGEFTSDRWIPRTKSQ